MPDLTWLMNVANNHDLSATKLTHLPESILDAWQMAANHCGADPDRFAQMIADKLGIQVCDFNAAEDVVSRFTPHKLAKEKHLVPVRLEGLDVVIAMANPKNVALAGVVSYEPSGSEYRLVLKAKDRMARIERDGSLHLEENNNP